MKTKKPQTLRVETWTTAGITVEEIPMDAEMQKAMANLSAAFEKHGCKCKRPHPDHIRMVPRGHSIDVFCTDCKGIRQAG